MKWGFRILVVCLVAVPGALSTAAPAVAKGDCHKVDNLVVGEVDFATGTLVGHVEGGGILHKGTATGTFVFTGVDPETGIATYEGTFEVTTKKGTVEFDLFDGVLNLATNSGTNDSVVTGGTGVFEGATGGLFFEGSVGPNGESLDQITGEICRA